jgi:hypothetical protein
VHRGTAWGYNNAVKVAFAIKVATVDLLCPSHGADRARRCVDFGLVAVVEIQKEKYKMRAGYIN